MGFPAARTPGPCILRLWHCCCVWAMGPPEPGDATAAASTAFPSGGVRRAAGFTAKSLGQSLPLLLLVPLTWAFLILSPPFSPSPAALEEQRVSRRRWGRKSFLAALEMGQTSACRSCVGAVHGKKERNATHPKAFQSLPTPHRPYVAVSCSLPPSKLNITDPLPCQPFPSSPWPSCPRVPLIPLSHTSFSWGPFAHLPQKKGVPPSPSMDLTLDVGEKSLNGPHAAPPPPLGSPELNQSTAHTSSARGTEQNYTRAGLCSHLCPSRPGAHFTSAPSYRWYV